MEGTAPVDAMNPHPSLWGQLKASAGAPVSPLECNRILRVLATLGNIFWSDGDGTAQLLPFARAGISPSSCLPNPWDRWKALQAQGTNRDSHMGKRIGRVEGVRQLEKSGKYKQK